MPINVGTIFHNRYLLLNEVGSGGMSTVWEALDNLSDTKVAIKIFRYHGTLTEAAKQSFVNEFKMMFNIINPYLARPMHFDIEPASQAPYLVSKYYQQGSAVSIINKTDLPISESLAAKFLHDASSALKYLHNLPTPIIHQDIKPDNFLMDDDGSFVLTDFGVSKRKRETRLMHGSQEENAAGEMAYMAPERFSHSSARAPQDIFSLGVTLYEILTGVLPFQQFGGRMLLNGFEVPSIDSGFNYSSRLNLICMHCMHPNPEKRPTAIDLLGWAREFQSSNFWPQIPYLDARRVRFEFEQDKALIQYDKLLNTPLNTLDEHSIESLVTKFKVVENELQTSLSLKIEELERKKGELRSFLELEKTYKDLKSFGLESKENLEQLGNKYKALDSVITTSLFNDRNKALEEKLKEIEAIEEEKLEQERQRKEAISLIEKAEAKFEKAKSLFSKNQNPDAELSDAVKFLEASLVIQPTENGRDLQDKIVVFKNEITVRREKEQIAIEIEAERKRQAEKFELQWQSFISKGDELTQLAKEDLDKDQPALASIDEAIAAYNKAATQRSTEALTSKIIFAGELRANIEYRLLQLDKRKKLIEQSANIEKEIINNLSADSNDLSKIDAAITLLKEAQLIKDEPIIAEKINSLNTTKREREHRIETQLKRKRLLNDAIKLIDTEEDHHKTGAINHSNLDKAKILLEKAAELGDDDSIIKEKQRLEHLLNKEAERKSRLEQYNSLLVSLDESILKIKDLYENEQGFNTEINNAKQIHGRASTIKNDPELEKRLRDLKQAEEKYTTAYAFYTQGDEQLKQSNQLLLADTPDANLIKQAIQNYQQAEAIASAPFVFSRINKAQAHQRAVQSRVDELKSREALLIRANQFELTGIDNELTNLQKIDNLNQAIGLWKQAFAIRSTNEINGKIENAEGIIKELNETIARDEESGRKETQITEELEGSAGISEKPITIDPYKTLKIPAKKASQKGTVMEEKKNDQDKTPAPVIPLKTVRKRTLKIIGAAVILLLFMGGIYSLINIEPHGEVTAVSNLTSDTTVSTNYPAETITSLSLEKSQPAEKEAKKEELKETKTIAINDIKNDPELPEKNSIPPANAKNEPEIEEAPATPLPASPGGLDRIVRTIPEDRPVTTVSNIPRVSVNPGTIKELNKPPVISGETNYTVRLPRKSVDLSPTIKDPDGDNLRYSWSQPEGQNCKLSGTTSSNLHVEGLSQVNRTYSFTLTVRDTDNNATTQTFSVTLKNPR